MAEAQNLLVPTFRLNVMPNEAASKSAGRPIFQEMEICEIRFAGDRQKVAVFPAHEAEPNATRQAVENSTIMPGEVITYAMLYRDQYMAFKSSDAQSVTGTPLSELPFLTEARRRELRALNIHTAEALAALDGTPLKQLGMGGRADKDQAAAYIAKAQGSAVETALAAENAALKQMLAEQRELIQTYATPAEKTAFQKKIEAAAFEQETDRRDAEMMEALRSDLEGRSDADLKSYIREATGEPVKGNPNRDTLLQRALDVANGKVDA